MSFRALILLFTILFVSSCVQISHTRKEQRVVELPADNPEATLSTAQAICREVSGSLGAALHERFPQLTQQQFQGVFLNWNEGTFPKTGHTVFITTGMNYQGELPVSKEVADFCEAAVRRAVASRFSSPSR